MTGLLGCCHRLFAAKASLRDVSLLLFSIDCCWLCLLIDLFMMIRPSRSTPVLPAIRRCFWPSFFNNNKNAHIFFSSFLYEWLLFLLHSSCIHFCCCCYFVLLICDFLLGIGMRPVRSRLTERQQKRNSKNRKQKETRKNGRCHSVLSFSPTIQIKTNNNKKTARGAYSNVSCQSVFP